MDWRGEHTTLSFPGSKDYGVPLIDNEGVKQARPSPVQGPKGRTGGRSGLHRAA